MIVISDAGPLIALSKIDLLYILQKFFKEVIIPEGVWKEVVERGKGKPSSKIVEKADWITIRKVKDKLSVDVLCHGIDRGEAETIVLAKELDANLILLDEKIPREIARFLDLKVVGSLALLHEAIERGMIDQSLEGIVKKMRKRGIWIGDDIIEKIKKEKIN